MAVMKANIKAASALLAVAVPSGIVGASIVLMRFSAISPEAFASLMVAAGTLALAYFTWQSVARTNDVIAGEDRRHQQNHAPALLVVTLSGSANAEWTISLQNRGIGPAKNVRIHLEGVWCKMQDSTRIETPFSSDEKDHTLSFLSTNRDDYGTFTFGSPSADKQAVKVSLIDVKYDDMFGNEYETRYPKGLVAFGDFVWHQPKHLRIPNPESR